MFLKSSTEEERLRAAAPAYWSLRSMRLKIVLLVCFSIFSVNVARTSMSVAMVCMVNSTALAELKQENPEWLFTNNRTNRTSVDRVVPDGCSLPDSVRSEYQGEFIWVPSQQSWMFAAVFWGSTLTTLVAGLLADRYGPKSLFTVAAVVVGLGTALTPPAAHTHLWLAVLARLFVGLGSGLIMPAASTLVAKWFPPVERGTAAALYTTGSQMASIVGNPFSAFLCSKKEFLGGWPAIFYTSAVVLGTFLVFWTILSSSTPQENRFISEAEKEYLVAATTASGNRKDHLKIPWKAIFTSPVIYACLANSTAAVMGISLLQTYLPTYYKDVLLLDLSQYLWTLSYYFSVDNNVCVRSEASYLLAIFWEAEKNGLLSALPFMCMLVMKFICAFVSDFLKRTGRVQPTAMCKICNTIAGFGSAICLAGVALMDCSTKKYALALSCMATGCFGGFVVGVTTSMLLIAPRFAGIVSAIVLTAGSISAAFMPYMIGALTPHGTAEEWRVVFGIMIVALMSSSVMFLIWGSAEVQPWAINPQPSSVTLTKENESDAFQPVLSQSDAVKEDSKPHSVNSGILILMPVILILL